MKFKSDESLPLVSIIIPTYNPCNYLEKAISSLVSQDYKNIEIIVIDDSSHQLGRNYINELQKVFNFKIFFLTENSGGCAKPLNIGINLAVGKYVGVCAQDDFYLTNKIKTQVNFLEANPQFAMSYADTFTIIDDNDSNYIIQKTPKRKSGYIFDEILQQKFYIPAVSVLIKKEVFNVVGNFDQNLLIEDWDMWLRIAYGNKIGYISESLACYRSHQNNISKLKSTQMISDRMKILRKWEKTPYAKRAISIALFLDGQVDIKNVHSFIKHMLLSLWYLGQPVRWGRIVASKFVPDYLINKLKG